VRRLGRRLFVDLDFDGRAGRLDELIALLRDWPEAEELNLSLAGWSAPARPAHALPVWLGTSTTAGRAMTRVAGQAAGWFLTYPTVDEYRRAGRCLDQALALAGRLPTAVTRSALFRCCISGSREVLKKAAGLLAAHDQALEALVAGRPAGREDGVTRAGAAATARRRHLIGEPQAIAERLAGYRAAGMEHAVIAFVPVTDSSRSLEVFAQEVIPILRD